MKGSTKRSYNHVIKDKIHGKVDTLQGIRDKRHHMIRVLGLRVVVRLGNIYDKLGNLGGRNKDKEQYDDGDKGDVDSLVSGKTPDVVSAM